MKTKYLTLFSVGAIVTGCAQTASITLPNGGKGLIVDCTNSQWSTCFTSASDSCPNGYKIYERTLGEHTESKIPLTEMKEKTSSLYLPQHQQPIKLEDKYMVISCNTKNVKSTN